MPTSTRTALVICALVTASLALPVGRTTAQDAEGTVRVMWRYRVAASYIRSRPVVGSDRIVYVNDVGGTLHALTPDGQPKWSFPGAGAAGVTIGPDDTIYVGSEEAITAVHPDGTLKWRFSQNPRAFILLGPNVGPDGNIYAVATEGLGIFSLTPQGALRWTIPETYRRPIVDFQEIVFGRVAGGYQLYFHANDHFVGLRTTGQVRFDTPGGLSMLQGDSQPAVGPNRRVYINIFDPTAGLRLAAFTPAGEPLWRFFPIETNVVTAPDAGPDDVVYVGRNLSQLYAVDPDGTERWHYTDSGILFSPVVNRQNTAVFMGGRVTYGAPGFFTAVDTNGAFLGKVELPFENGGYIIPFSRPRFARNGRVAYVGTAIPGQDPDNEYSYLYAVRVLP